MAPSTSIKSNCLSDRSASAVAPQWFFRVQARTPIKSKSPTGHCGRYLEQLPLRPTTSAWRISRGSGSCRELVGLKKTSTGTYICTIIRSFSFFLYAVIPRRDNKVYRTVGRLVNRRPLNCPGIIRFLARANLKSRTTTVTCVILQNFSRSFETRVAE